MVKVVKADECLVMKVISECTVMLEFAMCVQIKAAAPQHQQKFSVSLDQIKVSPVCGREAEAGKAYNMADC